MPVNMRREPLTPALSPFGRGQGDKTRRRDAGAPRPCGGIDHHFESHPMESQRAGNREGSNSNSLAARDFANVMKADMRQNV